MVSKKIVDEKKKKENSKYQYTIVEEKPVYAKMNVQVTHIDDRTGKKTTTTKQVDVNTGKPIATDTIEKDVYASGGVIGVGSITTTRRGRIPQHNNKNYTTEYTEVTPQNTTISTEPIKISTEPIKEVSKEALERNKPFTPVGTQTKERKDYYEQDVLGGKELRIKKEDKRDYERVPINKLQEKEIKSEKTYNITNLGLQGVKPQNTFSKAENFGVMEKLQSKLPERTQQAIYGYQEGKKQNKFLEYGLTGAEGYVIGGGVGFATRGVIAGVTPVFKLSSNIIKLSKTGENVLNYGSKIGTSLSRSKTLIGVAKVTPYALVGTQATMEFTSGDTKKASKTIIGGVSFIKGFEGGFELGENTIISLSKFSKNYIPIEKTNIKPVEDVTIPTKLSLLRKQEGTMRGGTHVTMNLPKLSKERTFIVTRFPEETKGFRKVAEQYPLYKSLQIKEEETPAYLGYAGIVGKNPLSTESKSVFSLTRPQPNILYFEDYIQPTTKEQINIVKGKGNIIQKAKDIINMQSLKKGSTNIPAENLLGVSIERQTTTPEGSLIRIKPSKSFTIYETDGKLYRLNLYEAENIKSVSKENVIKNIKKEKIFIENKKINSVSSSRISIPLSISSSPSKSTSISSLSESFSTSSPSKSTSISSLSKSFSTSSPSKSRTNSVYSPPFIPIIPFKLPTLSGGRGSQGTQRSFTSVSSKRSFAYTPTLRGLLMGIKQSNKKQRFTGIEVRGI